MLKRVPNWRVITMPSGTAHLRAVNCEKVVEVGPSVQYGKYFVRTYGNDGSWVYLATFNYVDAAIRWAENIFTWTVKK